MPRWKFFLIPMLWFLIGLLVDRRHIERLLLMVMVIGVLTCLLYTSPSPRD